MNPQVHIHGIFRYTLAFPTAQNLILTTGLDVAEGGAGNDTNGGTIDDNTTANNTISAADIITGGDGTDTLIITGDVSAGGIRCQRLILLVLKF